MSASGTRTCRRCGGGGHDIRSCTVSDSKGHCVICGFQGHDGRNCPRK